jgi:hypothetical protein
MEENYHYATVTEAIAELRKQGYNVDFNIVGEHLVCDIVQLSYENFEIDQVYRYEGNSDPADEAVVYAIASPLGLKGVLVTGYGIYADAISEKILEKLSCRK